MATKKEQLFDNLSALENAVFEFEGEDRLKMKKLLMQVSDIVSEFNKGKNPTGDKQLDLSEKELTSLKERIERIWNFTERKNLTTWPQPDIVTKVG